MEFKKIVLASSSPRRRQLLEWAGVPFDVVIVSVDETFPAGLSRDKIAEHIASKKAEAAKIKILREQPHMVSLPIVAADTIVILNEKILGKPVDRTEAINMLTELSGTRHSVITGVVILRGNERISFSEETLVEFDILSAEQISYYVDHYKPYDKAGSYAIQEWIGITGIKFISGDYYNVIGLPVNRVLRNMQLLG